MILEKKLDIDNIFINTQKINYQNTNNQINIFYHMFCINDAFERFNRTYNKIIKSGLINSINNIYINCVGPKQTIIYDKIETLNINNKIIKIMGNDSNGESETLNMLRDFALINPFGKTLYLHSKGCWRTNKINNQKSLRDWIDCMEFFLIEQFEECLNILNTHDNCGILFKKISDWASEYSGNFWWSTNLYISKLYKCLKHNRFYAESRFLFPHRSKYFELYSYAGNLYHTEHPRILYTNKPPLII